MSLWQQAAAIVILVIIVKIALGRRSVLGGLGHQMQESQRVLNQQDRDRRDGSKPISPLRLANGEPLDGRPLQSGGLALDIRNPLDTDAVVVFLTHPGKKVSRGLYVRAFSDVALTDFARGTYKVYVHSGLDWDKQTRSFKWEPKHYVFDDPFEITDGLNGISLLPLVGSEASRSDVEPAKFPKIS